MREQFKKLSQEFAINCAKLIENSEDPVECVQHTTTAVCSVITLIMKMYIKEEMQQQYIESISHVLGLTIQGLPTFDKMDEQELRKEKK